MLVLTRKHQEKIRIGDHITITVLKTKGKSVRLGIEAPAEVPVKGKPLHHLEARVVHLDTSADFPLDVSLSGNLPDGTQIVAGADLRGDAPFRLDLEIQTENSCLPDSSLTYPDLEGEHVAELEYQGLITDFIEAVYRGEPNFSEVLEFFQSHRDLIQLEKLQLRVNNVCGSRMAEKGFEVWGENFFAIGSLRWPAFS